MSMSEETAFAWRESALKARDELARLRSDEWLEKAAEEIAASWEPRAVMYSSAPNKFEARIEALREVLRKHRDGAA